MKLILCITSFFFLCSVQLSAQQVYESPYVYEGTTFQLETPKGLYRIPMGLKNDEISAFAADSNFDIRSMRGSNLSTDILLIMHMPSEGRPLESFKSDIEEKVKSEGSDAESSIRFVVKPEIIQVNKRNFFVFGIKGKMERIEVDHLFMAVTKFGDYCVMLNFSAPKKKSAISSMKEFSKLLETFQVIPTEKENGKEFMDMESEWEEAEVDEEYELHETEIVEEEAYEPAHLNDLYPTVFSHYDLKADRDLMSEEWNASFGDGQHLLGRFGYNVDEGFVSVFSGGKANNYTTDSDIKLTLLDVFELDEEPSFVYDKLVSSNRSELKKYVITNKYTENNLIAFYTTELKGELIFFVVTTGQNTSGRFHVSYEEFVKSLTLESLEMEIEEMEINEEPK